MAALDYKQCRKCGVTKPSCLFRTDRRTCKLCIAQIQREQYSTRGKIYCRNWSLRHPEKKKAIHDLWVQHNRKHLNAYQRIYWKQWSDPAKSHKYYAKYFLENRDKVLAHNKKWKTKNKDKLILYSRLRRAKQIIPSWAELNKISVVYKKAAQYGFEVDHVVPIKSKLVCGLHVWNNLQLLSATENQKKGNRTWPDMPEAN